MATFVNTSKSSVAEYLATEALDYLMTEDNDYIITGVGSFSNIQKS